jgi:hypothetical protein
MRRLASFVAIFLLLTVVAPVLACVTGSAMSREESACCRSMQGQCGDMAKMGCCRTEVRTDETPQIAAVSPATDVQWVVVAQVSPQISAMQTVAPALLQVPEDYFPPGLVTAKTTVLRI